MPRKPAAAPPAKRKPRPKAKPSAAAAVPAKKGDVGGRQPPNTKLNDEQRAFIVVQLACYRTLSAIQKDVLDRYGIEISLNGIHHYDPVARSASDKKWEDLFYTARAKYLEEVSEEPLAHQRHRLRLLNEGVQANLEIIHGGPKELTIDATEALRKLVETASKELGGVFTNVKKGSLELTGAVAFTPDEKRNVLEDKLKEIIEGRFTVMKPAKAVEKG